MPSNLAARLVMANAAVAVSRANEERRAQGDSPRLPDMFQGTSFLAVEIRELAGRLGDDADALGAANHSRSLDGMRAASVALSQHQLQIAELLVTLQRVLAFHAERAKAATVACVAYQVSDGVVCDVCNLRWDANDPYPPKCKRETS